MNGIGREAGALAAASAFVEAVDRGLPFCTSGVLLLFGGMTRIKSTTDKDKLPKHFDSAFEFVRRLVPRTDIGQIFTVVRLAGSSSSGNVIRPP